MRSLILTLAILTLPAAALASDPHKVKNFKSYWNAQSTPQTTTSLQNCDPKTNKTCESQQRAVERAMKKKAAAKRAAPKAAEPAAAATAPAAPAAEPAKQ